MFQQKYIAKSQYVKYENISQSLHKQLPTVDSEKYTYSAWHNNLFVNSIHIGITLVPRTHTHTPNSSRLHIFVICKHCSTFKKHPNQMLLFCLYDVKMLARIWLQTSHISLWLNLQLDFKCLCGVRTFFAQRNWLKTNQPKMYETNEIFQNCMWIFIRIPLHSAHISEVTPVLMFYACQKVKHFILLVVVVIHSAL